MDLSQQNAQYIKQLNQNNVILERNITVLEQRLRAMEDSLNAVARDSAAMQRATIEFLKEKELIKDDEDLRLLQKLHMKNISQLDQEIAARKAAKKSEGLP